MEFATPEYENETETIMFVAARFLRAPLFLLGALLLLIPARSSAQTRDDCLACHSDESLTTERRGREVSLYVDDAHFKGSVHEKLVCVACHTGFNPEELPHKANIRPVNCMTCHTDAGRIHAFHPQMASVRGTEQDDDKNCKACHGRHDVKRITDPETGHAGSAVAEVCGTCHGDVVEAYTLSAHGQAVRQNVVGAPNCITCHQSDVVHGHHGSEDLALAKRHQEKLCLTCHLDDPDVRARTSPSAGFIRSYESSVHGKAILSGNGNAAGCVDCHGSHRMAKAVATGSTVNKSHIPGTCAKCHAEIDSVYEQSVHGVALRRGVKDAPACTDCHGEHNILQHLDPNSPVAAANVSSKVCSPCHSSVRLSEKYGIASDRFSTYSDSYHGLAVSASSVAAANCASCHGAHNIKNSQDSTSTVHKSNLSKTCGKCHPGANERFSIGAVHVNTASKSEPILYWVTTAYILLIIVVIGGMLLHNGLDFVRKSKRKLMQRRGLIVEEKLAHRLYVRMSFDERLQHATLAISFIMLVLTGFALRFPDAWWVASIRDISPVMFDIRGIMHRIAAVVMVGASAYHIYYVTATERGRQLIKDLLPRLSDVSDAIGVMRYNLGMSQEKPQFDRFSYIEKSEYWALVWGTIVMAVTGVILWFDNTFLGLLTKLGWDVARTIHYYEAWLATLAIIVWHFYFVIFNPDIYPINLAFWKGTLTEEEMAEEHPLELERIHRGEAETDDSDKGGR